jgi:hypothetical protein
MSDRFPKIADTDSANYAKPNEKVVIRMSESGVPCTEKTRYRSGNAHNRLDVVRGKGAGEGENSKLDSQARNDARVNCRITDDERKKAKKQP